MSLSIDLPNYVEPIFIGLRVVLMILVAIAGLATLSRDSTIRFPNLGIGSLLVLWFVAVWVLLRLGAYRPILLPLFISIPVVTAALLAQTRAGKRFIDAVPQQGLIGIQIFRVVGGSFLFLWLDGLMPGLFAIPVGVGDILVGISALLLAILIARGIYLPRTIVGWNLFGLADHIMALVLGATTAPGPLQQFSLEQSNVLVVSYPVGIIPTFIIPLSFILHGLSLWKLQRLR